MRINNDDFNSFTKGKTKGFESIFHKLYPTLVSFATGHSLDIMVAEDVVMEILNKSWEKKEGFKSIDSLISFLYTSVHHKSINVYRNTKNRERLLSENFSDTEEFSYKDILIEEEMHWLLYNAIEKLPKKCKEVLKLNMQGLTLKEIAEDLKLSLNTIKSHKKKALSVLREIFKHNPDMLLLIIAIFNNNIS